jgi:two-component system, NtrC family, response regulator AlgB
MIEAVRGAWSALILDDDPGVRQSIRLCVEADDARALGVATSSGALEALDRGRFDVVFLDLWLGAQSGLEVLPEILRRQPDAGIIVVTAFASFETAVEAMKLGAVDYLPKPFTPEQVRHAARRVIEAKLLRRQVLEMRERLAQTDVEGSFHWSSPVYRDLLETAARVAAADCVVLLRGESGTGKNVLARWIRERSPRAAAPFAIVDCPALSSELMSSTLFGHRKGAFTGAIADSVGKVQEAETGTLLLDEVGDLSADAQARLLRFLNDRSYERLGEAKDRTADVRLIAATNRHLEDLVREGRFREDLFYRLNVVTLTLPPLRDRREDILPLAQHYLAFAAQRVDRTSPVFSPEAEAAIVAHTWPGNLRELRNAIDRAAILATSPVLTAVDLGLGHLAAATGRLGAARAAGSVALGGDVSIEDLEREHIALVLARAPTLEAAARTLGIDSTTLQRKRKRYGLA